MFVFLKFYSQGFPRPSCTEIYFEIETDTTTRLADIWLQIKPGKQQNENEERVLWCILSWSHQSNNQR